MRRLFTPSQEAEICKRYIAKESTSVIANSLGTGHRVINGVLKRNNIAIRTRGRYISVDYNLIFTLYKQGLSDGEIAGKLNCTKGLVQSAIYKKKPEIRRGRSEAIKISQRTKNRKWVNGKPELRGSKNPLWKGGKTELSQAIRADALYKKWRSNIFERDEYICQDCGDKSAPGNKVILHADHIIPLHELIDIHRLKTIEQSRNCESLWDISNGRTLCRSCHKKTATYRVNRHIK
ncbi:HNH endonuclease [Nostoc sp.]|uniref:HNH endonuclease n=1 Tax=Nostoc sp. TaxID=1180 RepID=UPI002FF5E559